MPYDRYGKCKDDKRLNESFVAVFPTLCERR